MRSIGAARGIITEEGTQLLVNGRGYFVRKNYCSSYRIAMIQEEIPPTELSALFVSSEVRILAEMATQLYAIQYYVIFRHPVLFLRKTHYNWMLRTVYVSMEREIPVNYNGGNISLDSLYTKVKIYKF